MANFTVIFAPAAERDLKRVSAEVASRIKKKANGELGKDPSPRGDTVKWLQRIKPTTYRLRIGDFRAVFRVQGAEVWVLRVVHKSDVDREVYRLMSKK